MFIAQMVIISEGEFSPVMKTDNTSYEQTVHFSKVICRWNRYGPWWRCQWECCNENIALAKMCVIACNWCLLASENSRIHIPIRDVQVLQRLWTVFFRNHATCRRLSWLKVNVFDSIDTHYTIFAAPKLFCVIVPPQLRSHDFRFCASASCTPK